ncbi:MAG: DUF1616 domain-containing protein [Candidatus Bathyarchaeota archaeon]|nr:DUF1616 domain-containing protein [Candidatus Bathyarchaeota archaeon]
MSTNPHEAVLAAAKNLQQPTVDDLVEHLTAKGLKQSDAIKAVYVEWKKGTLNLTEPNPPRNIAKYFFSLQNAWFWAITALLAVTALAIFTVNSSTLLYVRYVLGGVFVLFLPGFMLISALYPRSEELDMLERVALSIGLSLALVPLVGLGLNYTPWGIRLEPIVASMALLVEALALATVTRKFRYHMLGLVGS